MRNFNIPSRKMTINTEELLAKVKENREKHIKDYDEACEEYRQAIVFEASEIVEDIKSQMAAMTEAKKPTRLNVQTSTLPVPKSYSKAYDRVISILTMEVHEEVCLTSEEHALFVMDEWDWQEEFQTSKSAVSNRFR